MNNRLKKIILMSFLFIFTLTISGIISPISGETFKKRKLVYTSFMSDKTLGAQADIAFWKYVEETLEVQLQ